MTAALAALSSLCLCAAAASTPPASLSPTPVPTPSATGVSGRDADAALSAFNRAYYVETLGVGRYRATTDGTSLTSFWRSAELLEMVEDAYQASRTQATRRLIGELRRGVLLRYGAVWTSGRAFNDDVLWMVLAFIRAYELTGDRTSRDLARQNFDATVARGLSDDLGGGLWWTTDEREKNACVNGPGAIAAYRLYQAFADPAYLERARSLYAWERTSLFDPDSGAVFDHVSQTADGAGVVNRQTYTYNQGTFIGAASALYRATGVPSYYLDALQAYAYARDHLTVAGVLRSEGGEGGDAGGFRGIFARYAAEFTRGSAVEGAGAWLTLNAQTAWAHRDARGLIGKDWTQPTPRGRLNAFDCSSAVVMMQVLRRL